MHQALSQHAFTFPSDPLALLHKGDWQAQLNLASGFSAQTNITLDKRAQRKFVPDLSRYYPKRAKRKGTNGFTIIELHIDEQGLVEQYKIIETSPEGVFEKAVERLIKHIRYQAAEHQGRPHKDVQRLKLVWNIQ